jgi:RNA polymerase sigma-32 factor
VVKKIYHLGEKYTPPGQYRSPLRVYQSVTRRATKMTRTKLHTPLRQRQAVTSLTVEGELRRYFSDLAKNPLLTAEEERDLGRKVHAGDLAAFQKLVASNLRLVVKIVLQYRSTPSQLMDLIQEGNIGLARAARHFDPERGIRFAPYAIWWIRAAILRTIVEQHRLVKLGTTATQRKIFFQLDRVRARIAALEGEATDERVAEVIGVKREDVTDLESRMHRPEASLDAPMGGEGRPLSDVLADHSASPEDEALRSDLCEFVREAIERGSLASTARERAILEHRLLADEPMTLDELGEKFGVSRERIRQLEKMLLAQLRRQLLSRLQRRELTDFIREAA